jgi:hypothetical protein
MNPTQLEAVTAEIAAVLFRSIDPEAQYLVVVPDRAAPFTTQRLLNRLPANLVGHRDDPAGRPIRDSGIYRITDTGTGHNQIAEGWVDALVSSGTAIQKQGQAITVDEIWSAALVEVMARLEPAEESQ